MYTHQKNSITAGVPVAEAKKAVIFIHGLGYNNEQIGNTFAKWDEGRLQCFLIEITKDVFKVKDPKSGGYLIDIIKDEAMVPFTNRGQNTLCTSVIGSNISVNPYISFFS